MARMAFDVTLKRSTFPMNLSRKSFLNLLAATFAFPWVGWASTGSKQGLHNRKPVALDPWLREWLRQPRIPVLESAEPVVVRLIDAALRGEEVEFAYFGGSEPGRPRRISPGMVFHLESSDVPVRRRVLPWPKAGAGVSRGPDRAGHPSGDLTTSCYYGRRLRFVFPEQRAPMADTPWLASSGVPR